MTPGPDDHSVAGRTMRLRYTGTCRSCDAVLAAGTPAVYERTTKTVLCTNCRAPAHPSDLELSRDVPEAAPMIIERPPLLEVAAGSAGASARREYERRRAKREDRIRTAHPKLGGLILALSDEPQSTIAWATGARGEVLLGKRLDGLAVHGVRMLHDRRIPPTKANIDHIAVSAAGAFVIDTKRYKGRPQLRVEGGLFRPRAEKLVVGTRDQTKLIDGVHKQAGLVRAALNAAGHTEVPIHAVLCFVEADWPIIGASFVINGVAVLSPKKLAERLVPSGGLDDATTQDVHRALASAFPAA